MKPTYTGLLATALVLALAWKLFDQPDTEAEAHAEVAPAPTQAVDRLERRIDMLEAELTHAIEQRKQLEDRLAMLERGQSQVSGQAAADALQAQQPDGNEQTEQREELSQARQQEETEPLEERMIAAGLPEETVAAIQQRIDGNRLQMLNLRDRAVREGWDDSQQYREQIHQLNDPTRDLRDEFGDEVFDQYLYAAGRPNRVVVRDVYGGSAAALAGIEAGDIITGYASNNIFTMSDLRQGTVQGSAGETVLVEIIRDGEPFTTSVARGPLGISMQTATVKPR